MWIRVETKRWWIQQSYGNLKINIIRIILIVIEQLLKLTWILLKVELRREELTFYAIYKRSKWLRRKIQIRNLWTSYNNIAITFLNLRNWK